MNNIESEGNKTDNKDVMLKVYSEALNEYRYRQNLIVYSSYVALFVAGVAIPLVLEMNVEDIGFKPILFYGIFFGLALILGIAYCSLIGRENDIRIKAKKMAKKIEDNLFTEDKLKLINNIYEIEKKEEKKIMKKIASSLVSSLSKVVTLFFFICWCLLLLLAISKYV